MPMDEKAKVKLLELMKRAWACEQTCKMMEEDMWMSWESDMEDKMEEKIEDKMDDKIEKEEPSTEWEWTIVVVMKKEEMPWSLQEKINAMNMKNKSKRDMMTKYGI